MIDLMLQTHIHKSQAAPTVELKNVLAKWGTRCSLLNKVAEARKKFDEMPKRDVDLSSESLPQYQTT